ncbi:MAG: hypothetical protein LC746_08420 [Acidobacteria bacterium]|nr:hypothetical protein [Acidobacteriota bacterium]
MKKLSRERIRLAIEKKRIDDELEALINKVTPELDADIRETYKDDPETPARWEEDWKVISAAPQPRPKAKRAAPPEKKEES